VEANVDEIEPFLDSVVSHENWNPGSPLLHDLSNLDSGPLSLNAINRIADSATIVESDWERVRLRWLRYVIWNLDSHEC